MYLNYLVDWVEKVPETKENTHLRTGPVFPPGLASCGLKRTPGRRSGPGVRPGGDELVERGAEGGCFPPGMFWPRTGPLAIWVFSRRDVDRITEPPMFLIAILLPNSVG